MSKKGFADADLNDQYKKVELISAFLEALKPKVSEKLKGAQSSIDRGKALADCLTGASSSTKGVDSSDIGNSTISLLSETARLLKLFEVLQANFNAQLGIDVDTPLERFLNSELQTVKIYKRKYEDAAAELETAVNKLTQIKLNPKLRQDVTKLAEAENESTRRKEQFEIAKESASVVMADVLALYHVQLAQMLVGTVDAAADFFARGHQQFSEYRTKMEPVRQQLARKRQEYFGQPRQPREPDAVKSGVLEKRSKQGKFVPRHFVLKWRYLLAFDKDDNSKLRSVVQLRGTLIVTEAPAQKRPYCISIKLPGKEWILAAPTKQDQDAWIVAISDCIDRKAADRKGASFIELPPLSPHSSSMTDAWTHKGSRVFTSAAADPKKDLFKQLMVEERSYVQQLSAVVNAYLYPLRDDDTGLMREIGVTDETAVFSHAEQLMQHHRDMLKQMQDLLDAWPEQSVGQFFVDKAHVLQLYVPYIENFSNAIFILTRARKSSKPFEQLLKKCQAAAANEGGEELELLLSHPLNRITQYKRFFTQLVGMSNANEAGHRSIEEATELVSELCASVTQSNRSASDLASLITLSKKFEGYDGELVTLGRRVVKEASMMVTVDGVKSETFVFLLSDQVIGTKKQSGLLKDRYKVQSVSNLLKAHVSDVPDDPFAFQLTEAAPASRVLLFNASSVQEKQEWCGLLNSCINDQSNRHFFGQPLAELMSSKRQKGHDIPVFVEKAIAYLENHVNAEGLFRLSGQGSIVEQYRAALDSGQDIDFDPSTDPHVVTGLLKMWFRELPEPIMTWDLYDPVVQALAEKDEFNRLTYVRTLMLQLPPTNRYVLQHLFKFLRKVAAQSSVNKMASKNLSIVFGPNLLRKRKQGNESAPEMNMLNESNEANEVLIIFIDNYDAVFEDIERDRMDRLALLREDSQREEAAARKSSDKPTSRLTSRLSANLPPQRVDHPTEEWKEGDIVKQGWLEKKNPEAKDKKAKWEPRYFVLRAKYLVYYLQPTDPQPVGKVRLSNSTIESSSRKGHCITIKSPLEKVVLAAKSDAEKTEWLNVLTTRRGELNPSVVKESPTLGRAGRSSSFLGPQATNNLLGPSNSPPKPVQLVSTPTADATPTYVKARMSIGTTTLTNVSGTAPPVVAAPVAPAAGSSAPKPDSFARRASGLLQRTVSFTSALRTSSGSSGSGSGSVASSSALAEPAKGSSTDRDSKREAIARKGPAPPPPQP